MTKKTETMGKDFEQLSVRISYQSCIYMRAEYETILCSIFFLLRSNQTFV